MRKQLILLVLMLLPSVALAQPSIHFETEEHDFGSVHPGDQPSFVFVFKNTGTGVLEIGDVSTS